MNRRDPRQFDNSPDQIMLSEESKEATEDNEEDYNLFEMEENDVGDDTRILDRSHGSESQQNYL